MISRLTSLAIAFSVICAATMAFAAEARQDRVQARAQLPVVQLERVVVSAKRAI